MTSSGGAGLNVGTLDCDQVVMDFLYRYLRTKSLADALDTTTYTGDTCLSAVRLVSPLEVKTLSSALH